MRRSRKILLIANNFPPVRGGSAVVYDNLARFSEGKVMVVAARINYTDGLPLIGWREHDRLAPYRVLRLKLLRTVIADMAGGGGSRRLVFLAADVWIRVRLALVLVWLVMRDNVRTVCVGELLASGWVFDVLRLFPFVRRLVYVHGEEITTEDPYDEDFRRRRRALHAADRIIVVSHFTQSVVRDLLGPSAAQKIDLIENGVDTARFRPGPRNAKLVAQYRLESCFVFVSVCRLLEKKGIDHAIRAFATLAAQDPQLRYLIVGTGPYAETLQRIAGDVGVEGQVIFTGQVPDDELVDHYRLGDVFVMPNRALANGDTEGFGLVFLEANGCGLPVIAGRDGGSTDAVRDGVNGLVVDGASVPAIAAAMQALRDDGALRARLTAGGAAAAEAADWRGKARTFRGLCDADTGLVPARA